MKKILQVVAALTLAALFFGCAPVTGDGTGTGAGAGTGTGAGTGSGAGTGTGAGNSNVGSADVEKALKSGIADVTSFVGSKEELISVIEDSVMEYAQLFMSQPGPYGSRSVVKVPENTKAKGVAEAVKQISKVVTDVTAKVEDLSKLGMEPVKLDFDETVNIANLSVGEYFDVVMQIWDKVNDAMGVKPEKEVLCEHPDGYDFAMLEYHWIDDECFNTIWFYSKDGYDPKFLDVLITEEMQFEYMNKGMGFTSWTNEKGKRVCGFRNSVFSSSEVKQQLEELLKMYDLTLAEATSILDGFVKISNIYASVKADVDVPAEMEPGKTLTLGTVSAEALLNFGFIDINKLLEKLSELQILPLGNGKINLPVKAVEIDVEAMAKGTVVSDMLMMDSAAFGKSDIKVAAGVGVKAAVCTKDKKGGIISLQTDGDVDGKLVESILSMMTGEFNPEELLKVADKGATLTVAVSNGTKNTYEEKFTVSQVYELVMEAIAGGAE